MSALSVPLYNTDGKPVGTQELSPKVFGVPVRPAVLYEAVRAQRANARHPVAHTKTRGEVRGGGKKPWKQKGTGRARHGSIRSPIWIGGGITFGPRAERNFSLKINRKTKNLALRMSLSDKVAAGKLLVLNELTAADYKTKVMASMFRSLPMQEKQRLVVLATHDEKVLMSNRNIPGVRTVHAASVSLLDVLNAGVLITTKDGIAVIEGILGPKVPA